MATYNLLEKEKHDAYDFISPNGALKGAAKAKTVLITGAGTGIGKATAHTFAVAGASHLILAARRLEQLEGTKAYVNKDYPECKVQVVATDISKPESVRNLFASLEPGVVPDLLINNAGRGGTMRRVDEEDDDVEIERWWYDFAVNARGPYLVTRAYLKLLAGRRGRIINTSSNASWMEIDGLCSYAMSKAAMNRLSEYVDKENKDNGTRCFSMHPGGVVTELVEQTGLENEEWVKNLLTEKPELAAATALYLSTDRADFLGGRYVVATHDMEKLEALKEKIVSEDLFKTRVLGVARTVL